MSFNDKRRGRGRDKRDRFGDDNFGFEAPSFPGELRAGERSGGGGFGGFGKVLGQVVQQTGGGNWGNTTANVTGAVVSKTIVGATISQNIKAKEEITLEIKLQKGDSNAFSKQYKAKAKSDGEDILSPMIEQAAQAILDTVNR